MIADVIAEKCRILIKIKKLAEKTTTTTVHVKKKIFDSTGKKKKTGNTQKCLMIWENINMVITRLKIKAEKEIALADI